MSIQAVGWTNTGNCCGNQQIKPRYQVFWKESITSTLNYKYMCFLTKVKKLNE